MLRPYGLPQSDPARGICGVELLVVYGLSGGTWFVSPAVGLLCFPLVYGILELLCSLTLTLTPTLFTQFLLSFTPPIPQWHNDTSSPSQDHQRHDR